MNTYPAEEDLVKGDRRFGRPNAFCICIFRMVKIDSKEFRMRVEKKDALEPHRSELQGSPSVLFPECCVGLEH